MAKKNALPADKSAELLPEPKKRGVKKITAESVPVDEEVTENIELQPEPVKKRGRPKKEAAAAEITEIQPKTPARKRSGSQKEVIDGQLVDEGNKVPEVSTNLLDESRITLVDAELPEEFKFLDKAEYVRLHLEKGMTLYSAGDVAERVFFVEKGSVLIIVAGTDGQILSEIKSGEICVFSAVSVLGNSHNRYMAIVETTSDILAVPADDFRSLIASSAAARAFVFESIAEQMSVPSRLLEEISLRRSDVRLAKAVGRYVSVENAVCNRSISDLAEDALLSPETTEILLKEFRRRGYLAMNNKNIIVTDRAALIRKSLE